MSGLQFQSESGSVLGRATVVGFAAAVAVWIA